jgi:hypothetical protein
MTLVQPNGVQWLVHLLRRKMSNICKFSLTECNIKKEICSSPMTFSLPEFNIKNQMCSSWKFYVYDRSKSSSTYNMIIGNGPRSPWRIRHNHELP